MEYHGDDAIEAYLELARQQPELFRNCAAESRSDIIEILMDRTEIARAQGAAREFRASRGMPMVDVRAGLLAADPYMTLIRDAVRFPDGSLGLYNRVLEGRCVAAVPILDGKLVLIRIFRHGLRSWSVEFPRGACEPGEQPDHAIRRELGEEIGAEVTDLVDLGEFTPGGSTLAIRATLFAAYIGGIGEPDRADAIQKVAVYEVGEVERLIASGEIIDAWTMSVFLRARLCGLI